MKDLTKGNILKVVLLFALPIIASSVMQSLYNMGDSAIVSNLIGEKALAAVGATGVIINTLISFINGGTQGYAIPIARFFGARDFKSLRRSIAGAIWLTLIMIVILTGTFLILAPSILRALNTPEEIMPLALIYIRINIAGLVFTAIYNFCTNTLRAVGDSKTPLYFLLIGIALNILLDILLIGPFHMGIAGAAFATIFSQLVAGGLSLIYMLRKYHELMPKGQDFKVGSQLYSELLTTGLAMSFMGCIVNIGTIILQSGINTLDTTIIAAHTAARRVFEIMSACEYTVGIAMTTFVSQNLGAGKIDRIRKGVRQTIIFTLCETLVLIVFVFLAGRLLIHLITGSDSPVLLDAATMYVRISIVNFFWLGPLFILRCTMQGLGHKIIPLFTSAIEMITKIVSVIILTPALQYLGIAITEPISWFLCTLLIGSFYLTHKPTKEDAPATYARA